MVKLGEWECVFLARVSVFPARMVIYRQNGDRFQCLAPDGMVKDCSSGGAVSDEYCWNIPDEALQGIMDALWGKGIRPKDRRFEEEIKRVEAHLEDMRKLVFEKRVK